MFWIGLSYSSSAAAHQSVQSVPDSDQNRQRMVVISSIKLTVVQCLLYHEKCNVSNGRAAVPPVVDASAVLRGFEGKHATRQWASFALSCSGMEVQILAISALRAPRIVSTSLTCVSGYDASRAEVCI